jgi:hypothetical protein
MGALYRCGVRRRGAAHLHIWFLRTIASGLLAALAFGGSWYATDMYCFINRALIQMNINLPAR